MIGNIIFVFIVEAIILPIFILFFNFNLFSDVIPLLLVILLGTIGFVSVGTLFSAIALNTKLREVLLPILLFPIIIPVIVSSVKLSSSILNGSGIGKTGSSLQILVSFDIIFLVLCAVVFEYVVEE
ncbi:MAG TPA: heme exporter protein CcmB, partial [Thermodesulfobacteriota bacterium]